jgi:two-component system, chemotaxis family, protein-glutamate methylesterase/glutaminase
MSDLKTPNSEVHSQIKVLITEDSAVIREFLCSILSSDPAIKVIGMARDGEEALKMVELLKPDVITMDIHMPKMDGFEATRHIMETYPVPIIIVSGSSSVTEIATTFNALEAGALSCVSRPSGLGHPDHERTAKELVQNVKLMSEVKVVRRLFPTRKKIMTTPVPVIILETPKTQVEVVAIGSSTGGPVALKNILSMLNNNFPVPILIVQHMSPGFIKGFADWLSESSGFPVKLGTDNEPLQAGQAYVAPDGFHMQVGTNKRIKLSQEPFENGLRPTVSHLFLSVANIFGKSAIGVLLTGMGGDGAKELKLMKDNGSITLAQDEASSVVFGMPGVAEKLGAAMYFLPPEKIAAALTDMVKRR